MNGTGTGSGNGNGAGAAHANMRMFIQVLTFTISVVVTSIGGTLFILNRIDDVKYQLVIMEQKFSSAMTIHKIEDWTLAEQRLYNKALADRNTNIVVPDLGTIIMHATVPP